MKTIASMKNGQQATVSHIDGGKQRAEKLESLGIRKGVRVTKKSSLPMRGPVIVCFGNTEVALGHRMAACIFVEVV